MFNKEEAKQEVRKLIELYNSNKDSFKESSEADIRIKLIDRLFEILGWDVWGKKAGNEVSREETVRMKENKKKKADYAFRLHGIPKFVVEAKAIKNIDLTSDEFREQTVGYAYNLACSWAVLTNFVGMRIYFVDKEDGVVTFNISNISDLDSFDKNFEILWLLSNDAVKNDLLGKYLDDKGIKPQKEKVGKQLYEDLKEWRSTLSNEVKSNYKDYEKYVIDEIVQRIIDRLIFIRKVEDMELEERRLEMLARSFNKGAAYRQLKIIFRTYRQKYNSGLFGDKEEHECDRIEIDDRAIEPVIRGMYKPKGRKIEYNFAVIDADVLGNIYEQYLAYILKETPNHKKAELEGGRSHRKEQGIYYTPIYIVDYIVKNTVSEALKSKTIDEILSTKILDPACGSGSFLIRAFSEVCKIVEDKMKKGDRSKISPSLKDYSGRLTMNQKIAILLSCIYGVDLDKKAVEIAQLNLLFKLLEGETAETISQIEGLRKILPTLNSNIKHGNSLIDDKKIAGDDAFNWEEQFSDIMKSGGFDIVIGNPPWVFTRGEHFSDSEKQYFDRFLSERDIIQQNKGKNIQSGKLNLYSLFVLRSIDLMKQSSIFGFIIPNNILRTTTYDIVRKYILDKTSISSIVDLSTGIFEGVTASSVILTFKKENDKIIRDKNDIKIISEVNNLVNKEYNEHKTKQKYFYDNPSFTFNIFSNIEIIKINKKIESDAQKMGSLCEYIIEGIVGSKDRDVSDRKLNNLYKPFIVGKDIGKYRIDYKGKWICYDKNRLHRARPEEVFLSKKILVQRISGGNTPLVAALDENKYYTFASINNIVLKNDAKIDINYILAILNSKLMNWYYATNFSNKSELTVNISKTFLEQLPIKIIPPKEQQPLIKLVDKMLSLNKKLSEIKAKTDARARLEEEIKKTDAEIDGLVYKLYGITEEEKKIIEESLR